MTRSSRKDFISIILVAPYDITRREWTMPKKSFDFEHQFQAKLFSSGLVLAFYFSLKSLFYRFISSPEPEAHWWACIRRLSSVVVVRRPHSSNIFSSETIGPIKVRFNMEPPWDGGTKVFSNHPQVTWPRWPPCPYMVKTLTSILLWNQKADDL